MELKLTGKKVLDSQRKITVDYSKSNCRVLDGVINPITDSLFKTYSQMLEKKESSAFRELAIYFGNHSFFNKIDVSDLSSIKFESDDDKKLELVGYNEDWFVTNYLIECYDKCRCNFFDENREIQRYVIVPSSESSFKIYDEIDNSGKVTSWMVFRICLSGLTALNDSSFIKYLTKELFKNVKTPLDSIKLACPNIDGIDIRTLKSLEINDKIVTYDSLLHKYIFNAYKDILEKRGFEIDEQYGIKNYEIKKRGINL